MAIEKGNIIKLEYEGKLEDGRIFDSSNGNPLEFEIGSGKVIPGFEKNILNMEKGEEKEFAIESEEAYGPIREELYKEIPKSAFNFDKEPEEGMGLMISTPQGQQIPTKIIKVNPETITIDLNHPLAGKKLIFKIKILDVKK